MSPRRVMQISQELHFSSTQLKLPAPEVERVADSLCQMKDVKAVCSNQGRDITIYLEANSDRSMKAIEAKVVDKIGHAVRRHKAASGAAEQEAILAMLKS